MFPGLEVSDRGEGDDEGGDADPEEDPPLRPDIVCHTVLSSEVSREPELQKASDNIFVNVTTLRKRNNNPIFV